MKGLVISVKRVLRVTEITGNILIVFSVAALLVMLFITIVDVIMRNIFNSPVVGAIEIARMMMICMCPSFVAAMVNKRHISVGMFVDKLGRNGQIAFDTVSYLASSAICGFISYQGFVDMLRRITRGDVYTMLRIPVWPFMMLFAVAMGVFSIVIIIYLVDIYLDKTKYLKHDAIPIVPDQKGVS